MSMSLILLTSKDVLTYNGQFILNVDTLYTALVVSYALSLLNVQLFSLLVVSVISYHIGQRKTTNLF